jgi:hypothetical protein
MTGLPEIWTGAGERILRRAKGSPSYARMQLTYCLRQRGEHLQLCRCGGCKELDGIIASLHELLKGREEPPAPERYP